MMLSSFSLAKIEFVRLNSHSNGNIAFNLLSSRCAHILIPHISIGSERDRAPANERLGIVVAAFCSKIYKCEFLFLPWTQAYITATLAVCMCVRACLTWTPTVLFQQGKKIKWYFTLTYFSPFASLPSRSYSISSSLWIALSMLKPIKSFTYT